MQIVSCNVLLAFLCAFKDNEFSAYMYNLMFLRKINTKVILQRQHFCAFCTFCEKLFRAFETISPITGHNRNFPSICKWHADWENYLLFAHFPQGHAACHPSSSLFLKLFQGSLLSNLTVMS